MQENLYAIIGKDIFLVENEVNKIIDSLNVNPFNIITFDLEEDDLEAFLYEITSVNLLSDEKVIKVKNPWFFYEQSEIDLTPLISYFKNPEEETVLIFMLNDEFNNSLLISKEAKKYLRIDVIEELSKDKLPEYTKEYFNKKGYEINDDALEELLKRVDYSYQLLRNELLKLELLKINEKRITLNDVKLLVARNYEDNLFELSTAVIEKNREKAITSYYDLLIRGIDAISIVSNLAGKIKETITTKHLLTKGLSQQSVADYFNISNGRAYYMIKNANNQDFRFLEASYKSLAELDYKIKSGQIDKNLGLELWLLGGYDVK